MLIIEESTASVVLPNTVTSKDKPLELNGVRARNHAQDRSRRNPEK